MRKKKNLSLLGRHISVALFFFIGESGKKGRKVRWLQQGVDGAFTVIT